MMVYVVIYSFVDCGETILGIYDNENDALTRLNRYKEKEGIGHWESLFIENYELNRGYRKDDETGDWNDDACGYDDDLLIREDS